MDVASVMKDVPARHIPEAYVHTERSQKMHTNVAHVRSATIIHRPPSTVYIQMAAIYTGHVHAAHRGVRKIEQEN